MSAINRSVFICKLNFCSCLYVQVSHVLFSLVHYRDNVDDLAPNPQIQVMKYDAEAECHFKKAETSSGFNFDPIAPTFSKVAIFRKYSSWP